MRGGSFRYWALFIALVLFATQVRAPPNKDVDTDDEEEEDDSQSRFPNGHGGGSTGPQNGPGGHQNGPQNGNQNQNGGGGNWQGQNGGGGNWQGQNGGGGNWQGQNGGGGNWQGQNGGGGNWQGQNGGGGNWQGQNGGGGNQGNYPQSQMGNYPQSQGGTQNWQAPQCNWYPPNQNGYGPPQGGYNGPPGNNMGPPGNNMGPPGSHMGPPGSNMGPPGNNMGPPGSRMGPPGSNMGPPGNNMGPPQGGWQGQNGGGGNWQGQNGGGGNWQGQNGGGGNWQGQNGGGGNWQGQNGGGGNWQGQNGGGGNWQGQNGGGGNWQGQNGGGGNWQGQNGGGYQNQNPGTDTDQWIANSGRNEMRTECDPSVQKKWINDWTPEVESARDLLSTKRFDKLLVLLASMDFDQRAQLMEHLQTKFNVPLLSRLNTPTEADKAAGYGPYSKLLAVAMLTPPAKFDAEQLKQALEQKNVDTKDVYEILATRTKWQIVKVKEEFAKISTGRKALDVVIKEKVPEDKKTKHRELLLALASPARKEYNIYNSQNDMWTYSDDAAQAIAGELQAASKKSDLELTYGEKFQLNDYFMLRKVIEKYNSTSKKGTMRSVLEAKFVIKGNVLDKVKGKVASYTPFGEGLLKIHDVALSVTDSFIRFFYEAYKGAGTHNNDLIRLAVSRSQIDLKSIRKNFASRVSEKSLLNESVKNRADQLYLIKQLKEEVDVAKEKAYFHGLMALIIGNYHEGRYIEYPFAKMEKFRTLDKKKSYTEALAGIY